MNGRTFLTDTEGSAILEVAFALPFLLAILGGMVDFGLYEERKMQVVEAANAGAAFAAQGGNQLNGSGIQNAAMSASPSLSGLNVSTSMFWTCTPGGQAVSNTSDCGSGESPLQYVTVTTSAVVNAPLPVATLGSAIAVRGTATYRVRWSPS